MTYEWNANGSMLDPSTVWIAAHSALAEPAVSRAWKRLTLTFTIAAVWGGLAAGVVLQWRELRKAGRR